MDIGRTCVNLIGNCLATVVVARWEGEFDDTPAKVFGTPPKPDGTRCGSLRTSAPWFSRCKLSGAMFHYFA
ncbi:MAG: hypothetical protein QOE26_532 [Verrucomicrobiota bacterium]|jgi:hypothetical protein